MKNFLSMLALILSLAALQSPLWQPKNSARLLTIETGTSLVVAYDRDVEKAGIMERKTATPILKSVREVMVHGNAPGRTTLIICSKDGRSEMYDVMVKTGAGTPTGRLVVSR